MTKSGEKKRRERDREGEKRRERVKATNAHSVRGF